MSPTRKNVLSAEDKAKLVHPSALKAEDWNIACRLNTNVCHWAASTTHAMLGGALRLFSGESCNPAGDGIRYAKFWHYVGTGEFPKAAKYLAVNKLGPVVGDHFPGEVQYYLDYIQGTGEFGPKPSAAAAPAGDPIVAKLAHLERLVGQLTAQIQIQSKPTTKTLLEEMYQRGLISAEALAAV